MRLIETAFSIKSPKSKHQETQRVCMRLTYTSLEVVKGWDYDKASISGKGVAFFWVASNEYLGSNWTIKDRSRIKEPPQPEVNEDDSGVKEKQDGPQKGAKKTKKVGKGVQFQQEYVEEVKQETMESRMLNQDQRPYHTYCILRTGEGMIEDGPKAAQKVVGYANQVAEGLKIGDNTTVFYVFPREIQQDNSLLPYPVNGFRPRRNEGPSNPYLKGKGNTGRGGPIRNHRNQREKCKKWSKLSQVNPYAGRPIWIQPGRRLYERFLIGHTKPIEKILNANFAHALASQGIYFEKADIQGPSVIIIGWLCLANVDAVDVKEYSRLLKAQDRFKGIELGVRSVSHKMTPTSEYIKPSDPRATTVLVVETIRDQLIQWTASKECKEIFNKNSVNRLLQRPGLGQFLFVP